MVLSAHTLQVYVFDEHILLSISLYLLASSHIHIITTIDFVSRHLFQSMPTRVSPVVCRAASLIYKTDGTPP